MDPAQTILLLTAAGAFDGPKEPREHQPSGCELEPDPVACQQAKNEAILYVSVAIIAAFVVAKLWSWRNKS